MKMNYLKLLTCCFIGMTACNDDHALEPQEENPTQGKPDTEVHYEGFESYLFTLDQSQIPTLGGSYEAEKNVPQAKLIGISPENEVETDILKKNQTEVELGFDCQLQAVKEHLVVFAKKGSLKEEPSQPKATVIRVKDLKMVSQVSFSVEKNIEPDFLVAATADKALFGVSGKKINQLNLKTGEISLFKELSFDAFVGTACYEDCLFIYNKQEQSIDLLGINDASKKHSIKMPQPIRRLYPLNDCWLLAQSSNDNFLISMKELTVTEPFQLPSSLSAKDLIYDSKNKLLFIPGKSSDKNKVYTMSLDKKEDKPSLFYEIPTEDIKLSHPISGNIKLGIHPLSNELYIANIADLVIISNGDDANPIRRASRTGRISRISLKDGLPQQPVKKANKVTSVDDMFAFSAFFFLSKEQ